MRIPNDLKPGDRLWYSKTKHAKVAENPYDGVSVMAYTEGSDMTVYSLEDGIEIDHDTPPVIRIERIERVAELLAAGTIEEGGEIRRTTSGRAAKVLTVRA